MSKRADYKLTPQLHALSLGAGTQAFQDLIKDLNWVLQQIWLTGQDLTAIEFGQAGTTAVEIEAAEFLEPGRAITARGTLASASDSTNTDVAGIATSSAVAGEPVSLVSAGAVPLIGFNRGDRLWLGNAGQIVATPPIVGFQLQMGLALSPSVVLIMMGEPLILA